MNFSILKIVCKHLVRLRFTLYRRCKMFFLKCQYGNQFKYKKFHFRNGFHIRIGENGSVYIGKNCFFNRYCSITSRKKIVIGDNCIFGENIKIYDHNHEYKNKDKLICEQGLVDEDVIIEDNCWIGSNVTILKGVRIGSGSVIGAGAVIYKDIPKDTLIISKQIFLEKSRF